MTGRTTARLLAPTALVATALALLLILSGGGSEPTSDNGTASPAQNSTTQSGSGEEASSSGGGSGGSGNGGRRRYTVEPGDTPSGIAEKVGIPLEELLDLNPEVDPQTLSPGQKLRLR